MFQYFLPRSKKADGEYYKLTRSDQVTALAKNENLTLRMLKTDQTYVPGATDSISHLLELPAT